MRVTLLPENSRGSFVFQSARRRLADRCTELTNRYKELPPAVGAATGTTTRRTHESGSDGSASVAMRDALRVLGVEWVFEIREYGPDFERHAETVAMVYTGAEGLFTSQRLDWIVFASHEGVTTVDGVIVPAIKDAWPSWQSGVWTGWT